MSEILKNMNEVLQSFYDGEILTTDGKDRFLMKDEKIFCYKDGTRFSLNIKDFSELYEKNRFLIYEESFEIDETKDEAYYRYYRK